jgi:heme exporter protein A
VAETAIELQSAGRRFGERDALRGLDLTVESGTSVAVLGANGAGKTTLLRMLCGLLRPHSGRVSVLGNELPKKAWAIRGRVGLLAHDPMLYRQLTVRENLHHQARLLSVPASRANSLIEQVGIESRADEPLFNLSRGTIQRAAVARALLCEPELLLLDEPFANLDPGGAARVQPLLMTGRTVLISGHDPASLLAATDRAIGLRDGRIIFTANSGEVDSAMLEAAYR